MTRSSIFFLCLLLTSCINHQNEKPNIILFFYDDLGYGELGAYGQKIIQTKNIDNLASNGLKFTNFYSGSPVCAPSRSILLTGLHAGHTKIRGNHEYGSRGDVWDYHKMSEDPNLEGQYPIGKEELIFPKLLKGAGYTNAMVGKWGLGPPNSTSIPTEMGFSYFYGYNCQRMAHNLYPPHLWENEDRDMLDNEVISPKLKLQPGQDPYKEENYNVFNQNDYAPDMMHSKAQKFIENNKDNPFFLYYASPIPHAPLQAPQYLIDKYRNIIGDEEPYLGDKGYFPNRYPRATYAAMIEYIDIQVGEIIEQLKRLNIYDNTIILITSDNGPTYAGGVDFEYFNSTGIFQNDPKRMKGYVYEGGVRVPMIISWPEKIKNNRVVDDVSISYDIFPTLSEMSGADNLYSYSTDGVSLVDIFTDETKSLDREYIYWEFPSYGGQQAARMGDYKAILKDIKKGNKKIELYDLSKDSKEENDISLKFPEVVKEFKNIFKKEHVKSDIRRFEMGYIDED
ncbi:MAG: arylsulfatase [Cytophagales bacterium]|nr:arylsulfatase [Cytophagales bacterium]